MVIVCFIIALLSFSSCKASYKYMHEQSEITDVCIVMLHFDEEGYIYTSNICTVDNVEKFISDFNQVDCSIWWGDPIGLIPEETDEKLIVKLIYSNGDYELIHWSGQARYTESSGMKNYIGIRMFDEKQFEELISKYTNNHS